jgi:hypothetical protein
VRESTVRLQWDPDHDPFGAELERRAIQIGLRGEALKAFGKREIIEIIDLAGFVADQRKCLTEWGVSGLATPRERVYRPSDPAAIASLQLSEAEPR